MTFTAPRSLAYRARVLDDSNLDLLQRAIITPGAAWIEERALAEGAAAFAGLLDGTIATPKIILRP